MKKTLPAYPPGTRTTRQRITLELEAGPMTARDLSQSIRISEKEVIVHLEHVIRSTKAPKRFIMEAPVCNKCNFGFPNRVRLTSPSRCPQCRHEGIQPPAFKIITEK